MDVPAQIYTQRLHSYLKFIRFVMYPQGLNAFFRSFPITTPPKKVLDAGCGTGVVTLELRKAWEAKHIPLGTFQAFDLTPAMLDEFKKTLEDQHISGIEIAQANVLDLNSLPSSWNHYDLIVTASMLEYVAKEKIKDALKGLFERLNKDGQFILFMSKQNIWNHFLISRWWKANLYKKAELTQLLSEVGFVDIRFLRFPFWHSSLAIWGHIVVARKSPDK